MNSDKVFDVVVTAIIFLVTGFVIGHLFGHIDGKVEIIKEAFDRGYAVQCIGKEGYYWECKE